MIGLVVHKCGMARVYSEDGHSHGVTVLSVPVQKVAQKKTLEKDGYTAFQVAVDLVKRSKVTKPLAGHFQKAGIEPAKSLHEFRVSSDLLDSKNLGDEISIDVFKAGDSVDVSGRTIGRGFAGVVKRWGFRTQDASHGNSVSHRAPGSIGQNQTPGRVFKGKKMAGHMGDVNRTIQSLTIHSVDAENNLILVRGAVPGKPGQVLVVSPAVKKKQGGSK